MFLFSFAHQRAFVACLLFFKISALLYFIRPPFLFNQPALAYPPVWLRHCGPEKDTVGTDDDSESVAEKVCRNLSNLNSLFGFRPACLLLCLRLSPHSLPLWQRSAWVKEQDSFMASLPFTLSSVWWSILIRQILNYTNQSKANNIMVCELIFPKYVIVKSILSRRKTPRTTIENPGR